MRMGRRRHATGPSNLTAQWFTRTRPTQRYGLITMYLKVSVPAPVRFPLFVFRNVIVAVFAAVHVAALTTTVCVTE